MPHLLIVLALLPLPSLSTIARAQAATAPPTQPLFANLTMPLDISRAKIGTHVQARVVTPWTGSGCALRLGALVEGHVSQVERRSKTAPRSAMHLVIDSAECNHQHAIPFKATLIALLGPSDAPAGMGKAPPLTDTPLPIGMRSVEAAAAANQYALTGRSVPDQWKIGMVVDVPMNLSVGSGAEGGSIVWSTTIDARLEGQTTLILIETPPPPPTPAPTAP
jgi:hypothetical protein